MNVVVVGRAGHGPDWDQAGGHPRGEEHDLQVAREAALHQAQDSGGDRTGDGGASLQPIILSFGSFWYWLYPHTFFRAVDPDSLNSDPDPAFQVIPDQIRIQGFGY